MGVKNLEKIQSSEFMVVIFLCGEKWGRVAESGERWGNFCLASGLVRSYVEVK